MGIATAEAYGSRRFHQPAGGRCHASVAAAADRYNKVCFHWQAGRCNRHPCPFLHSEFEKKAHQPPQGSLVWRNPNPTAGKQGGSLASPLPRHQPETRSDPQPSPVNNRNVCKYFISGKDCSFGEKCKFLHSWFVGDSFSLLASLQGHQDTITGIALPSGSNKLYSASHDETVQAWDCHTGQCLGAVNMGGKVCCMISDEKGQWVFVGLPNAVKACNTQTSAIVTLGGPIGQVYALAVDDDLKLFAGTQDGRILAWKLVGDAVGNCFEPAASLTGHQRSVVSLLIRGGRLYSGSMDNTIRIWDLATLQCLHTLSSHTDVVMSVLCWNEFLLSGSLDGTIKVWAKTESGDIHVIYTHNEQHGVLALTGMPDAQAKPVLCCSCNDNSVRLYDLPSFAERGKMFCKKEVRATSSGPGIFFTGDGTGELKVWQWRANI